MDTIGTMAGHSRSTWRKSSYSTGNGSECVEVGDAGQAIAVRDSKNPDGPSLLVSPTAWTTLTRQIKSGHLLA